MKIKNKLKVSKLNCLRQKLKPDSVESKYKITHFILILPENIFFFVAGKGIIIVKNQFGGAAVEQMTKKYIRYADTRIYAIRYHRIRTAYINLNFQGDRKLIVYR